MASLTDFQKAKTINKWFEPRMGVYKIIVDSIERQYMVKIRNREYVKELLKIRAKKENQSNFEEYNWGIPVSQSRTSLMGQLSYLHERDSLVGKEITLIVKEVRRRDGISKDYTVLESIRMMMYENENSLSKNAEFDK